MQNIKQFETNLVSINTQQQKQQQHNKKLSVLVKYIQDGEVTEIKKIFENDLNFDVNTKFNGTSLVHYAVGEEQREIIQFLSQKQVNLNIIDDHDGNTPLHLAALEDRREMLKVLLDCGADIEATNRNKSSALHVAVEEGRFEIVELLLCKGAVPDSINDNGNTPLHIAVSKNNLKIAKTLLEWQPNIDVKNREGESFRGLIKTRKETEWRDLFEVYENRNFCLFIVMVVVFKVRQHYQKFRLMTNIRGDEEFNDFLLQYQIDGTEEWHSMFINCEQKNKRRILQDQLAWCLELVEKAKTHKLFENDTSQKFILCTSDDFDVSTDYWTELVDFKSFPLEIFNGDSFTSRVYSLQQEDRGLDQLEFKITSNFHLISFHPNILQLQEIILKAMNLEKCDLSSSDLMLVVIRKELYRYFRLNPGGLITENEVAKFMTTARTQLQVESCRRFFLDKQKEIEFHQIRFKREIPELRDFLFEANKAKSFLIKTQCISLTTTKVFQLLRSMNKNDKEFLFIADGKLQDKRTKEIILTILSTSNAFPFLLVETSNRVHVDDILLNLRDRKIILITSDEFCADYRFSDEEIDFSSLDGASQRKLMSKSIRLGRENYKIHDIFTLDTCERFFDSRILCESIGSGEICVGTGDFEEPKEDYVERTFVQSETEKVFTESELSLPSFEVSKKLFSISGHPGLGKSTFLRKLKHQLHAHGYWPLSLDLEVFATENSNSLFIDNFKVASEDPVTAADFLIKMLKQQFSAAASASKLFHELLISKDLDLQEKKFKGIIVLFDGLDRLHSEYLGNFFTFVQALERTNVQRIWLATRPHGQETIFTNLNALDLTLQHFSNENRTEYLLALIKRVLKANDGSSAKRVRNENLKKVFWIAAHGVGVSFRFDRYKDELLTLLGDEVFHIVGQDNDEIYWDFDLFLSNPLHIEMMLEFCLCDIALSDEQIPKALEEFVDHKFEIYFKEKKVEKENRLSLRVELEAEHSEFAYCLTYAEFELPSRFPLEKLKRMCQAGLLSYDNGRYTFVDENFKIYFRALYFLRNLHRTDVQKILLLKIFPDGDCKRYCSILNEWLENSGVDTYSNTDLTEEDVMLISLQESIFFIVSRGHLALLRLVHRFLEHDLFVKCCQNVSNYFGTILDGAARSMKFPEVFVFLKETCGDSCFELISSNSYKFRSNFLEVSTQNGNFRDFLRFFQKHNLEIDLKNVLQNGFRDSYNTLPQTATEYLTFDKFVEFLNEQFGEDFIKEIMKQKTDTTILDSALRSGSLEQIINYLRGIFTTDDFRSLLLHRADLFIEAVNRNNLPFVLKLFQEFCTKDSIRGFLLNKVPIRSLLVRSFRQRTHQYFLEFLQKYLSKDDFDVIYDENVSYIVHGIPEGFEELLGYLKKCCHEKSVERMVFLLLRDEMGSLPAFKESLEKIPDDYLESVLVLNDRKGNTLMHEAASRGVLIPIAGMLKGLLSSSNAFKDLLCAKTYENKTILHKSADSRFVEVLERNAFDFFKKELNEEEFHELLLCEDSLNKLFFEYSNSQSIILEKLKPYCREDAFTFLMSIVVKPKKAKKNKNKMMD